MTRAHVVVGQAYRLTATAGGFIRADIRALSVRSRCKWRQDPHTRDNL